MRIKPATVTISLLLLASTATAQWNPLNPVKSDEKQTDGVVFRMQSGLLRLQVCSDSIVRVLYTPASSFSAVKHYAVIKTSWPATRFSVESTGKDVTLSTLQLKVTVARKDGVIVFSDSAGNKLMQSSDRRMSPVVVNGERTYRAEEFITTWGSPEAFFGLGQHQAGVWNYRGESVDISQDNSNISIPLLLSTHGYGLFWDNPSRSRFNNRFMQALYISSEVADAIDYYFLFGPELDKVIAGFTGPLDNTKKK
jgi:alpha-D-xyloside xylohydrolase